MQDLFKRVKDFRAEADRLADGGSTDQHDHELLEVDGRVGMGSTINDVHHRYG